MGTNINIFSVLFLVIMGMLLIVLPRRYALFPIAGTVSYLTIGQTVDVAAVNFNAMRIIILFGWLRLVFRGEIFSAQFNIIDKAVITWIAASIAVSHITWQEPSGLINRLGLAYNALGIYFLFRFLIRDPEEIELAVKILAVIILPLALLMVLEWSTGRNLFSVFGGVPEITIVRGTRFRCQGPFRHPILAGTVGATLFPLFAGLWMKDMRNRFLASLGLASSTVIMVLSASFGPLLAFGAGILGLALWPLRSRMRAVTWGALLTLTTMHLLMKAPVWFLIGRLSNMIGGTGWHRSELIDQAVRHFNEWWLWGTNYTTHWAFSTGLTVLPDEPNMVDITNQYVLVAVNGGILPLILFVAVIAFCFRSLGKVIRMNESSFAEKMTAWSLGTGLFAHAMSFISVSYFDQIIVFWYLLLAMISTYTGYMLRVEEPLPEATNTRIIGGKEVVAIAR